MSEPLRTQPPRYGIAIDIGTTTLAAGLVRTDDGGTLGTASMPNPQSRWGMDVLSRINAIAEDPSLLGELNRAVVDACNGLISELIEASGLDRGGMAEITAAGNPAMEHILLGISPESMAKVPYRPAFKDSRRIRAAEAGLDAPAETMLYVFPLIGGFVGGDAVAAALATGISRTAEKTLTIDIGTNSEIILSTRQRIFATSAAAGPAFEAGQIRHGMTAEAGAISGVKANGDGIRLDVIGGVTPKGICGSGLVEAVSELLRAGIVDETGRIRSPEEVTTNLANRISTSEGGSSFVLFRGPAAEITLDQSDIRALQVAKAAIRAGISVLLERSGTAREEIERVYVAGAFGSHIKDEALARIGLLDKGWLGRVESVGDAALEGAKLALLGEDPKKEAEEIARRTSYVSLSGSRHFEREFIRNMNFTQQ